MQVNRLKVEMLLTSKGMTSKELATAYGASTNRIQVILNSVNVTPKTISKLAKALGVKPEDIINKERC